ncbi:MAG: three-Cys-motif partner protein TcmP [Anaerolineae bacterium]|nr:three-Cys-motif partner protein TcmP [Anaerolineae bacterium]
MTGQTDFGGDWTLEKLERVRKYLVAYTKIMNNQSWIESFAYIDAFAGTGYQSLKQDDNPNQPLFPELIEEEPLHFVDGSARIALQVEPRFKKYIFVEKDPSRYQELQKLREQFPDRASDILIVNADANTYLQDLCEKNWKRRRAVLFLDPFGMQVTWDTIQAIAQTKAIDLWYLFPLGIGVSRLLKRDGNINLAWRNRLDKVFGEPAWYDVFYKTYAELNLLGEQQRIVKIGDFDTISQYFVRRLKTIFPGVADNPLPLFNSTNNPLFLLCFASANERGAETAIKIAQDILKR